MKKTALLLGAALISTAAPADLANGNFSTGLAGRIAYLKSASQINSGWYVPDTAGHSFQITDGTATLNASKNTTAPVSIGQLFTSNKSGSLALSFDVSIVDRNANLNVRVQLYGYKQLTKETTILFDNSLKLINSAPPADTSYYAITELADYTRNRAGTLNNGDFTTQTVTFTVDKDYAFYGLRITANRPDADDRVSFDQFKIIRPESEIPQQ